ncbi:MAG: methyltransferase domain-containing protein [Terriglobia bacterium]
MQERPSPVNSQWREEYFAARSEDQRGNDPTRHFMVRLLAYLPPEESFFLRSQRLHFLDWGCAFGERVDQIAQTFPESHVVGLDFSAKAIEEARRRYPQYEFILAENGEISREFDCIFAANCLEHFEEPLGLVKTQLRSCKRLYVTLVPYKEFPRSKFHRAQFREESFPERLESFVRLCAQPFDVDPLYGTGKQLLVIYGSPSYLEERSPALKKDLEREKWNQYYESLPLFEADEGSREFNVELVDRFAELLPPGSKILEAGCGGGWQSLALARTGRFLVSLMDFSPGALQYARRLFEREKVSAEFISGDVFKNGEPEFDLVFNAGVLEHYTLEDQVQFVRGMASRSRNYVLALVPNRSCYWYWLWRIQKSAKGAWPFGKEMPLTGLSSAFEGAGLKFLGQTFMGGAWTEVFINNLSGMDDALRSELLAIHRSPVIPLPQKAYLLAALGSVLKTPPRIPSIWAASPDPKETERAEANAAIADALALRIGAEQKLSQFQSLLAERDQTVASLSAQVVERDSNFEALKNEVIAANARYADQDQTLTGLRALIAEKDVVLEALATQSSTLQTQLIEKDQKVNELDARVKEEEQALGVLSAQVEANARSQATLETRLADLEFQVGEKEQALRILTSEIASKDSVIQGLTAQAAARDLTIQSLSTQLTTKESELRRITGSLGWRLLSQYGKVKYRYLLPVYRTLHLMPSDAKNADRDQEASLPSRRIREGEGAGEILSGTPSKEPEASESGDSLHPAVSGSIRLEGRSDREQLAAIIGRVQESKGALIFLPSIGWDIVLFQRPHHLARTFAQHGYVSIFDCSNTNEMFEGFKEIEPNLFVFRGDEDLLHEIPDPVLWTFPYNFNQKDNYPPSTRTVYDWIDDLAVFPYDRAVLERIHEQALKEATFVTTVSRKLHAQVRAVRPDALYEPNGAEFWRFAEETLPPSNDPAVAGLLRQGKPIAGYYGALARWFDYDLLDAVADLRPDWNFLLIGQKLDESSDGHRVFARPNIVWIGPRDHRSIPGYLSVFDVATIPFLINDITQATSPLKLFEYFAGSKPVITTPMAECQAFPEVLIARDATEFSRMLDVARERGQDPHFRDRLRALGRANSWDARVQTMVNHLAGFPVVKDTNVLDSSRKGRVPVPSQAPKVVTSKAPLSPALEVTERFRHLRTPGNSRFFAALARHFSNLAKDPCLPMYFEFAITCNDRGRRVANLLRKYSDLHGQRSLDIGCAYGGFVAAFAEQGADAMGIDLNESLLALAQENLMDQGIDAPLLCRDATKSEEFKEFHGHFDIVTCNDVIEHVPEPVALLRNICDLLSDKGIAYLDIPNGKFPRFVMEDGHHQLFGITLLDYDDASRYYLLSGRTSSYDTYNYLEIDQYGKLFEQAGLRFTVLEEGVADSELKTILGDVAKLREHGKHGLKKVPEPVREKVAGRLAVYLDEIEQCPRNSASERRDFMRRYGTSFWRVIAYKTLSPPYPQKKATQDEQAVQALTLQLTQKEQAVEVLSAQLAAKESELSRITNSLGWRLLSRYGKIKYRYLLPMYRRLGFKPAEPRTERHVQSKPAQVREVESVSGSPVPGENPAFSFNTSRTYDLICFPIIDWDFRFQRPQQLATQFARAGHRVFYLRTNFHQSGNSVAVKAVSEMIHDVQFPGPAYLNLYREEMGEGTSDGFLSALDDLRRQARIADAVCLVQLPFWAPLATKVKDRWGWKIIYDCMDEHGGFSTNNRAMLQHEKTLLSQSDRVLVTSQALLEKASRFTSHTLLLPNAADFDHFCEPGPLRPLSDLSRPIIGYYGAISDWFDVEMIRHAAQSRPQWQFVLIGSTYGADVSSLMSFQNVKLLGEQAYAALPGYLHQFDVACIPFLLTPLTKATNPVKFYEYLSAGKPVVAVELPELQAYRSYFYPAKSPQEFVSQVEMALTERSPEKSRARIEFARQNTWVHRHEALSASILKLYPKVSIIVVSYNNPEYLPLCLESIWEKTTYPNFEVIAVDNGSEAQLTQYLEETAKKEARLKVILNGRNLGFAKANNIGIAATSDSEFIVLLNDDVVVTQGWLGKTVRYLKDSQVGLVGPVTNAIFNEARIDVDYTGVEEIDEFAEQYTSRHEGRCFDIPVLAMYCVGMRRSLVNEIGLLDERYGIGMFEDDDFSLRTRKAGYRVVCAEDIFIHHWGLASFRKLQADSYQRLFDENKKKFEEKWGQVWRPHQGRGARPSTS